MFKLEKRQLFTVIVSKQRRPDFSKRLCFGQLAIEPRVGLCPFLGFSVLICKMGVEDWLLSEWRLPGQLLSTCELICTQNLPCLSHWSVTMPKNLFLHPDFGFLFCFVLFLLFRASSQAYGASQARDSNRSYSCLAVPQPQQCQVH